MKDILKVTNELLTSIYQKDTSADNTCAIVSPLKRR